MKVGFTGTQEGMTVSQFVSFKKVAGGFQNLEYHHGDCIGSDKQSHDIICKSFPSTWIVIHPPSNPKKRAFCKGDETRPESPYLVRNRDIVNSTKRLIATPKGEEEPRGGTWSTIRYARKLNRPICIIKPDGSLEFENCTEEQFFNDQIRQ